ncbi:MAG: type II toxin-antitoxin system RelE/ParE family toxin [Verrucomicrobia bacterium]|nr:MAG: type II toxin-antitoxin system RelE/ParE family toxin [Verrucomicrobiota bacterium]
MGLQKGYPPGYLSRMKRTVLLYETESGARPVSKFLRKQTMQIRDATIAGFKHIENDTGADHLFKKMANTDDLWEIQIKYDKNISRLLCFFDGAAIVVVASGFQKKTQKTPPQEIRTAEARKKDYFRRKNNG